MIPALPAIPSDVRSVLLYGGSFDPPHVAHVRLPPLVRDRLSIDWLVYMPAARSPHKAAPTGAPSDDRCEMLRRVLASAERTSVSTLEVDRADRGEPSYTVDTVRTISETLAHEASLRLLIGADQAVAFHRWRDAELLMDLAPPVVMLRAPHDDPQRLLETISGHWPRDAIARWRSSFARVPVIDADATSVRALLARGAACPTHREHARLAAMLPEEVLGLIRERGLYSSV